MAQRRFGVKQLMIDGVVYLVRGGVSYSLGGDKSESVMGADRHHGYKISRIVAYLEATLADGGADFSLRKLIQISDSTITVDLENGKTIKFGHAAYVGEGKVTAEEGEIEARFECDPDDAEEI